MKQLIFIVLALIASASLAAQDIIVTKNAKKIDAKILEVSTSEIRYKELDNLDGPIFVLRADEINSIIYANGKVVLYNQPKSEEELAQERAKRVEKSRQDADLEQMDIDDLGRVRLEEEEARKQSELSAKQQQEERATAKAKSMGSLFDDNNSYKGNPVGYGGACGNSWTLAGRSLKGTLPHPSNNFRQEGKVVVQIRVNAAGKVTSATIKGGDVSDKKTQQLALDAAYKAKFTEGDSDQIGIITYIFKLN